MYATIHVDALCDFPCGTTERPHSNVGGNGVYVQQFPGLQFIGTRETRELISVNQSRYSRRVIAANSLPRVTLARLQDLRTASADSTGRPFSDADKILLNQVIGEI